VEDHQVTVTVLEEEHHISGTLGGYNVRKNAAEAVRFYAANNVFIGTLRKELSLA
jgi:hypothetical protein